ncbi:unnamed protein product [Paramecium primaurelia]|uniref:Uncharacterized protein n=2 Tax=Paramecium TaxID=5884 RepID=A0A8S1SBL2_9CILI|nr:unnamed protein product [Paramecium primaurelia]CAD8137576.1 unnamed protein product [Paramecium pentaurelia]
MLTGKEELDKINPKSAKGNAESEELPQYLRSSYSQTYQILEPTKILKGKKVFPQFAYGNSHEAPTYFKLSNSLVCKESYDNPYIKNKVPPLSKLDSLKGSTLNNYEFYNISDQRFTNRKPTGYITNKITDTITNQVKFVQKPLNDDKDQMFTFESAYKSIQDKLFNKKRELFTDFVEKNDLLNVYGPLNMRTRPKEFREVKNYALDSDQLKLLKEQRSRQQITPTNRSGFTDLIKTVRLPTISKNQGLDTDKYYNKDQHYLNQLSNSIIVEKIDENIKHKNKTLQSFNKNKRSIKHNTEDTENMQGIIDIFEKHLEFEKQYNC